MESNKTTEGYCINAYNQISIREIIQGYSEQTGNEQQPVTSMNGKLNIRPAYQREFVYDAEQSSAVIQTIMDELPLSSIYWALNDDGTYEVVDGQQRITSICQFADSTPGHNRITWNDNGNRRYFKNLQPEEAEKFLNYELPVYIFKGTNEKKIKWFQRANVQGLKLEPQEVRNAAYTGKWLNDAKYYFSGNNCPCSMEYGAFFDGAYNRQKVLETALKWIKDKEGFNDICEYMSIHCGDDKATELWCYVKDVMSWVRYTFPKSFKDELHEMKGVQWGILYNKFKDLNIDVDEKKVEELLGDLEVTNKKGIFEYLLTGDEKCLNIRKFSKDVKQKKYQEQNGICPICGGHFKFNDMDGDHIKPWSKGGKTTEDNCQMLCHDCNLKKSNR